MPACAKHRRLGLKSFPFSELWEGQPESELPAGIGQRKSINGENNNWINKKSVNLAARPP